MKVSVKKIQNVPVVKPKGMITEGEELETILRQLLDEGAEKIVIDFADVPHILSRGLGSLIGVAISAKKKGARVCLCNLDKRIQDVYVVFGLSGVFEICDTLDDCEATFLS